MTSRQSRSSSIPIPRSASATSGRPFTATVRPRISSAVNSVHRAVDDYRNLSVAGVRGSSSLATTSPVRTTARSFTHTPSMPTRTSPRYLTAFEPRVIRAETSRSADNPCLPSTSTSPTRTRRPSGAEIKPPTAQRQPVSQSSPTPPPPSSAFLRPAYLEHSALRHLLQPESSSSPLPTRTSGDTQLAGPRPRASSPQSDSDEESTVSPPRETPPTPFFSHYPILRLPTRWSDQVRHPSLSVSGDGRELTYQGQSSSTEKNAAAARTIHPIPPACGIYYYEVEIVSKGQRGHISIGLAGRDVRLSRLPGWEKNSWGYHGDDGLSFAAERNGTPYGPMFGTGDVIGCGIDFSQNRVFYTKNGTFLGLVFEGVGKDGDIYPSVGLSHTGEAVRVNFGQDPFKFDIEYHVQQQRNQTWAKIQSTPLDRIFVGENAGKSETPQLVSEESLKGPINQLVLSYLAHHGYAKTARAFQTQCERRGGLEKRIVRPVPAGDHDMDIDDIPTGVFDGLDSRIQDEDIELRTRIVNSVISGDIDTVITETRAHYPAVLEREEGLMLFKLRCRKFVELMLEASEMEKRMKAEEEKAEKDERSAVGDGMDVDDGVLMPMPLRGANGHGGSAAIPIRGKRKQMTVSPVRRRTGGAFAQYESALEKALAYGQTLDYDYKADRRPEVRSLCMRSFSIAERYDPIEAGGDAAEVAGHEARVALANELNQAILKSQGRPALPALEQLYRQTSACILQLGLCSVGAAAFADMAKEFLDV